MLHLRSGTIGFILSLCTVFLGHYSVSFGSIAKKKKEPSGGS